MTAVNKIDSNVTELRYAEEASIKVLPGSPVWKPTEPNDYTDFGGQVTTVAREPIESSRQRRKGTTVDFDASGGYNTDITLKNLQDLGQGFFFADLRRKGEGAVSSVDGATETYELDHAAGFFVGSLAFGDGHDNSANDGLKRLTAVNSVQADGTYTLAGNVSNNDTVTIGSTVYTFKTTLTGAAYEVLIGATASDSIDNLIAAINAAAGEGTTYGTDTEAHPDVTAAAGTGDTMDVTAILDGPGGNLIATLEAGAQSSWGAATLTGGDADVTVAENLTTETPTGTATLVVVGFQMGTSEVNIDVSGSLPKMVRASGTKDFTEFGLIPGEFIYMGGDAAATAWTNPTNNGFLRVRSVSATEVVFDKAEGTMVVETGTGKTIQLFFGRVLKNELGSSIVRRTYQLERQLGAPDDAALASVQAEYLVGAVPNELTLTAQTASKLEASLNFIALDAEYRTSAQGLKAGARPAVEDADALNSSSDVSRIKLATVVDGDEAPDPLFAFASEVILTVNNNCSPNKAIGVTGGFEVTAGGFDVGGSLDVYFSKVESIQAVRDNADVTIEVHSVKANAGISIDLPLISLGDGRLNIEKDEPIKLPLSMEAARGDKVAAALNHTALIVFFDYLPTAAD